MEKLVILGAGGFATEVAWLAKEINAAKHRWDIIGFIDENVANHGQQRCGLPILGGFEWFDQQDVSTIRVICGRGAPKTRMDLVQKAQAKGLQFTTLIHPLTQMSEYVEVGEGTVITAGSIVTTDVKIGRYVLLNLSLTIGHETVIEDFCTLAPHCTISGNTYIERGADLGSGVITIPGKRIGKGAVVGAGAVVTRDVPANVLAVGVPAIVKKVLE